MAFCYDLSERVPALAQVTSDGLQSYRFAMSSAMPRAQFAQLVKVYHHAPDRRDTVIRADKMPLFGDPDPAHISTSFIEASNLHLRMTNRRYARQTNAHSKKIANHCHMLAVIFMAYNFCRTHSTLKTTPAMAAGVTDRQWSMEDVIRMSDEHHEAKLAAEFEAAFAAKLTPNRQLPKTYPATPKDKLPIPWYLDPKTEKPPGDAELP